MDDLKKQTAVETKPIPTGFKKADSNPLPSMNAGWLVARRTLMNIIAVGAAWWMFTNGHIITGIVWALGSIVFFCMIFAPTEATKDGTTWKGEFDKTSPYNESNDNVDLTTILNSKSVPDGLKMVPTFGIDMSEPRFDVMMAASHPLTLDEIAMRSPFIISEVVKPAVEDTRSLAEIGDLKNVYGKPAGSLQGTGKFGAARVKTGTVGELETARILALFAERHPDAVIFHDLKLPAIPDKHDYVRQVRPDKNNHANIDHVVVIGDNIVPIDSKNYKIVDYSTSGRGDAQDVTALRRQKIDDDDVTNNIRRSNTFDMIRNRLARNFSKYHLKGPFVVLDGYGFETQLCTMQTFRWPGGMVMTEGELLANLEFIYYSQEVKKPANHYVVTSLLSLMN